MTGGATDGGGFFARGVAGELGIGGLYCLGAARTATRDEVSSAWEAAGELDRRGTDCVAAMKAGAADDEDFFAWEAAGELDIGGLYCLGAARTAARDEASFAWEAVGELDRRGADCVAAMTAGAAVFAVVAGAADRGGDAWCTAVERDAGGTILMTGALATILMGTVRRGLVAESEV